MSSLLLRSRLLTTTHTRITLRLGVAELVVFHPVDTIAKRLMSNKGKVSILMRLYIPDHTDAWLILGLVLHTLAHHLP